MRKIALIKIGMKYEMRKIVSTLEMRKTVLIKIGMKYVNKRKPRYFHQIRQVRATSKHVLTKVLT